MQYCKFCGNRINADAEICNYCGKRLKPSVNISDSGSFGWGVLGFFQPLIGLILYLVWKDEKPNNARIAGKGALISVILNVLFGVVAFIVYFFFLFSYTSFDTMQLIRLLIN